MNNIWNFVILGIAVHTMHGCQMIGMPECDVLLGQCVVYLTKTSKSRLIHNALESAKTIITRHKGPQPAVPLHIKDRSGERKLQAIFGKMSRVDSYLPLNYLIILFTCNSL